jgi:hypothetical protein
MKVTALLYTILAAATVGAAASVPVLETRDTCGPGHAGDQRRTGSPCQASNGDRRFCGSDRTGVVCWYPLTDTLVNLNLSRLVPLLLICHLCGKVQCRGGRWTEIQNCLPPSCRGGNDGGARC